MGILRQGGRIGHLRRLALAGACGLALATGGSPAFAAALRPYTIDEMMKTQDIGPGLFTPSGDALVYVQSPPYGQLPDYSLPFWAPFFGELMIADAAGGVGRPLFQTPANALCALINLSPDGRYVAYLEARDGVLSLGLFDRRTGANRRIAAPAQDLMHELTPTWIGPSTLAFTMRDPAEVGPYSPYEQKASGEAFYRAWKKSWDGKEASFSVYTSRADGGGNPPFKGALVLVDAATGTTRKLADGLFSDLRVSPDGRYLSGLRQFVKTQMAVETRGQDWAFGRTRLTVFDLKTGARTDVDPGLDVFPGSLEWSPQAPLIGFFAWPGDQSPRQGRFYTYDLAAGRLRQLPHTGLDLVNEREFGPPGKPLRFVWMGRDIAVPARPNPPGDATPRFTSRGVTGRDMNEDPGRFDWYLLGEAQPRNLTHRFAKVSPWAAGVTRSGAYLVLDDEVRRIDRSGRARPVAPGQRVAAQPLARSAARSGDREPFGAFAVFRAFGPGADRLLAFDLLRGAVRDIPLPSGSPQLVAVSQGSGELAYRETYAEGSDLKIRGGGESAHVVARINQFLAGVAKPVTATVSYTGHTGRRLTSCLTLPADYQPGRRYPTLVYVYPESTPSCPRQAELQRSAGYENRNILLSRGYALLQVANPDISTREGGPLDRIVEATDKAIDAAVAAGYVDPDRLGLIGASGAGFSGLWIAGHSRRFKALVSINGIADLHSHYFSNGLAEYFFPDLHPWDGEAIRYEGREQFGFGVTPWEDDAFYWRISPIAYADRINVPVLLVGTDMDTGGFSQQYDQMFVALHRLRKDVDYVKYWGEGHGPHSAANVRDLTERTLAWFDRYLGAGPK